MIERIVENWLTSSTERVYEVPFCQLLLSKGFRLIHQTTHGPTEQGKDIVTRDPKGVPCAFQLKTGDIKTREWREISGEINELIELAIDHPNIKPSEKHRAVLVTNGKLSDDVRTKITNLNRANRRRKLAPLETITGAELLTDFVKYFGEYLPASPKDFSLFLSLYLGDGTENLSEETLANFVEGLLITNKHKNLSARAKRELAGSTLVMVTYALKTYTDKANHLAVAKGYTLYCSNLLAAASKLEMSTAQWRASFDLGWAAIDRESEILKEETLAKKGILLEGDIFGDGGIVYRVRTTILLGWLAGFEVARYLKDTDYKIDLSLADLIRDQEIFYFGEYATIYLMMMAFYMELIGDKFYSNKILAEALQSLALQNSIRRNKFRPMPDPYARPESIIENLYGITDPRDQAEQIDFESFRGCSFTITSLIDALVRRNERDAIAAIWRDLSHIQHAEYLPNPKWESYLWRSHRGVEKNTAFPMTGSWTSLRQDSSTPPQFMPPFLQSMPWFCIAFLLTYPHRTSPDLIKLIDPTVGDESISSY